MNIEWFPSLKRNLYVLSTFSFALNSGALCYLRGSPSVCPVCCSLAEEEEDSAPGKVEEQRKMSQDSAHHTTGNE